MADLVFGQATFDTIPAGSDTTQMNSPIDVAVDSYGSLWVADAGNDRILRFDPTAGSVTDTTPDFWIDGDSTPTALTFDQGGTLWVCYGGTTVIVLYAADNSGRVTDTNADLTLTAVGPASPFGAPSDLAFDVDGNAYIAEKSNNRVLRIPNLENNPYGDTTPDLIFGQAGLAGTSSGTGVYGLNTPVFLVFDEKRNLYISDQGNNRVLRFDVPSGGAILTDTAANTAIGQIGLDTNVANNGGLSSASLSGPWGVTFGPRENCYVADAANNRLLVFPPLSPTINLLDESNFCFVATAAYGEDAPELEALRGVRDRLLMKTRLTRALVSGYYSNGPTLARRIGAQEVSGSVVRGMLLPLVGLGHLVARVGTVGTLGLLSLAFLFPFLVRGAFSWKKAQNLL